MGFAAMRDPWKRKIAAQIEEEPESKQKKPKTTSDTKSEKPISIFDENRKPNAKNSKKNM